MTPAVVVAACALTVGAVACTNSHGPAGARPTTSGLPTSTSSAPASCPAGSRGPDGAGAAIDYVDFVQAFGQQYIAGLSEPAAAAHLRPQDVGPILLRSRCSFSELSDRYGVIPPDQPRDGDTAFLPPGTPIHSVRGWPAQCRLAATADGRIRVYLAYRSDTKVATPRRCALRH